MSLGLTRDSIADLVSFGAQNGHNDVDTSTPPSKTYYYESEDDESGDDNFFFLDQDNDGDELEIIPSVDDTKQLSTNFHEDEKSSNSENGSNASDLENNKKASKLDTSVTTASYTASFSYDQSYYDDDYYSDPYSVFYDNGNKKTGENVFCCMFPFLGKKIDDEDKDVNDNEKVKDTDDDDSNTSAALSSKKHDSDISIDESTSSSVFVTKEENNTNSTDETVLNKESNMPDKSTTSDTEAVPSPTEETVKPLKGILKVTCKPIASVDDFKQLSRKIITKTSDADAKSRRSLFPTYEKRACTYVDDDQSSVDAGASKQMKSVDFASMARVKPIKSKDEMSFMEKSQVWWQKSDYDDFKKAARIIAKAMVEGGSEIWLQTSNAWAKKQVAKTDEKNSCERYNNALRSYGAIDQKSGENSKQNEDDVGSKWWCKFGHSRRGLEHIVSIEEGKQRQANVALAIQAVLDEQRKQRITFKDPKRLASVSVRHTSWAKELALAAGAADAEAVRSNFNTQAKCRIGFLKSVMMKKNGTNDQICASFIVRANPALTSQILDANTVSTIMINRDKKMKVYPISEDDLDHEEDGHHSHDFAKKAAGFGGGAGDMSFITSRA